jgi:tetratricopeptide (TPR) repeat protein
LTIIRPDETNDASARLVLNFIESKEDFRGALGTAALALEKKNFELVVEKLEPNRDRLDNLALVDLALAYDGLGKRSEAIQVLKEANRTDTDAMGVLAGRHKRNWLQDRIDEEARIALDLYSEAYELCQNDIT